jgi:hypothetical protein
MTTNVWLTYREYDASPKRMRNADDNMTPLASSMTIPATSKKLGAPHNTKRQISVALSIGANQRPATPTISAKLPPTNPGIFD